MMPHRYDIMRITKYPPVAASAGGYFARREMVRENTYVTIQAFMVNDLGLKGNELIVYAVIYGYSQDEGHWYYGTRSHLASWCGATIGTVSNCLKSLMDKGFLERREVEYPGYIQVQYRATRKFDTPTKNCNPPAKNFDTPLSNFDINDKDNNNNNDNNKKRFTPPTVDEVNSYMNERGTPIDGSAFYDYWESIGWMRGKTKMKDWKAAARQWARNDARWSKKKEVTWDAELREMADALAY